MSLPEFLVAMGLTGLLLVLVAPLVTGTSRATHSVDAAAVNSADARTALEILSRTLRTAARPSGQPAALVHADPTGVVLYSLLNRSGSAQSTDAVPVRVTYSYDGTCLRESTIAGTRLTGGAAGFTWTATPTTRCVLRTTVAPAFRYYSAAVISMNGVDSTPVTLPAGGLADAVALASITSIEVGLTARPAGSTTGTEVLGRVTLSNVLNGAVAS